MKKKTKIAITESIDNNTNLIESNFNITKSLKIEALIRTFLSFVFFIFIILNHDKVNKLSIITLDTIFNHQSFLTPLFIFYFCLTIAVIWNVISYVTAFISLHKLDIINTKSYFKYYKIYDFVSFIFSIIIIIYFIILFIITPVTISGNSMNNTLKDKDKCLIWHFMYQPDNEDIVIMDAKKYTNEDQFYIKRIVAKPNDQLYIQKAGNKYYFYVNNKVISNAFEVEYWYNITSKSEPIINQDSFIIPDNKYLLLGDNRSPGGSFDSRMFGLVDEVDILGKLIIRYYPFKDFGLPNKELKEVS